MTERIQASPQSPSSLKTKQRLRLFRWGDKTLSGRWERRAYFVLLLLVLLLSTATRLRTYLLTRKIEAVLQGLSEIRLDQTTEEQLTKMVPYLTEKHWNDKNFSYRSYDVHISNESDGLPWPIGYRYISFDAGVLVQDGKASQIAYGLANQWMRPQFAGYVGYMVTARSVHGFWRPGPLFISSVEDYSPQYRPARWGNTLAVIYTSDAPPELTKRIFNLKFNCFWGLRACEDAADIAPEISQDVGAIQKATYNQLTSSKCPDSVIEGRMRYLPDVSVLDLEVAGSRQIEVNEGGGKAEDWFTDYKLKGAIRGESFGSWKNVRFGRTIPSPMDPTRPIANQIYPETKIGQEVLYFGGVGFSSCRFIPATPSALEIVRNTPVPLKRPEDQIPRGLL